MEPFTTFRNRIGALAGTLIVSFLTTAGAAAGHATPMPPGDPVIGAAETSSGVPDGRWPGVAPPAAGRDRAIAARDGGARRQDADDDACDSALAALRATIDELDTLLSPMKRELGDLVKRIRKIYAARGLGFVFSMDESNGMATYFAVIDGEIDHGAGLAPDLDEELKSLLLRMKPLLKQRAKKVEEYKATLRECGPSRWPKEGATGRRDERVAGLGPHVDPRMVSKGDPEGGGSEGEGTEGEGSEGEGDPCERLRALAQRIEELKRAIDEGEKKAAEGEGLADTLAAIDKEIADAEAALDRDWKIWERLGKSTEKALQKYGENSQEYKTMRENRNNYLSKIQKHQERIAALKKRRAAEAAKLEAAKRAAEEVEKARQELERASAEHDKLKEECDEGTRGVGGFGFE